MAGTIFTGMGSFLANREEHYILERDVSLLIRPDTTFTRIGSIFAIRPRKESVPALCWKNKNDQPTSRAWVDQ